MAEGPRLSRARDPHPDDRALRRRQLREQRLGGARGRTVLSAVKRGLNLATFCDRK
jgi:hypothetical protein